MRNLIMMIMLLFFVFPLLLNGQTSFIPDSTVNSIMVLRNIHSVENFSQSTLDVLPVNEFDTSFFKEEQPFVLFVNYSQTEYLMAIIHEGTFKYWFSEFKIGYLCFECLINSKIQYVQTSYPSFYTESGLKLGVDTVDVVYQKGRPKYIGKNEILYCFNSNSSELDESDVCEYFLKCTICKDKVTKIEYGYDLW